MFDELFLKRLTQLRLQKGVSAREMSLAIGQSAGYINGIENGRSFPSMEVFFYICEYLNVPPKDFFDSGMENPNLLHGLEDKLLLLSEEQLHAISVLADGLTKGKRK